MVVHLISSPRNISTALMYAFANRKDTRVVDEPFYGYYLAKTGLKHPGYEEILDTMPLEVEAILGQLEDLASSMPVLFIKNMAHHLIDVDPGFMKRYANLFLIRDPAALITSFSKVIPHPTMSDIGCAMQFDLYRYLEQFHSFPVVDSQRVLAFPEYQMKTLCSILGIPFDEGMLKWKAGARPEDGCWAKYWYANVHRSTGFDTPSSNQPKLPEHCRALFEEALPYYQYLSQLAM